MNRLSRFFNGTGVLHLLTYLSSSQGSTNIYATSSNEFVPLLDSFWTSLLSLFQQQVHGGMCARIAAFCREGTEPSVLGGLCQLEGHVGDQGQQEKETQVDSSDHVV